MSPIPGHWTIIPPVWQGLLLPEKVNTAPPPFFSLRLAPAMAAAAAAQVIAASIGPSPSMPTARNAPGFCISRMAISPCKATTATAAGPFVLSLSFRSSSAYIRQQRHPERGGVVCYRSLFIKRYFIRRTFNPSPLKLMSSLICISLLPIYNP